MWFEGVLGGYFGGIEWIVKMLESWRVGEDEGLCHFGSWGHRLEWGDCETVVGKTETIGPADIVL